MASYQSHVSFSSIAAIAYACAGVFVFEIYPEQVLLAAVLVVVAGMLPNIDGSGDAPAREVGGLLAAVAPLVFIEFFPVVKAGGVARVALVVICGYLVTRVLVMRWLQKFTVPRGILHSIPAAVLTFELVYLLMWDLYLRDRLFVAGAAFVGYLSHLLLDAYGNLDLLGQAMGNAPKKKPVLKFTGSRWAPTLVVYVGMLVCGWLILRDFYPQLLITAGSK